MSRLGHEDVPWYTNLTFSRWAYESVLVASVTLNPVFRLSENVNTYKESLESKGLGFVYEDEIGKHWDRLQGFVIDELPERISRQQFEGYLEEAANNLTATVQGQGTGEQGVDYYAELIEIYSLDDDRGEYYILNDSISSEQENVFWEIASVVFPNGFLTLHSQLSYNENINLQIDATLKGRYRDKVSDRDIVIKWTDYLPSSNPSPSKSKFFGNTRFNTTIYNVIILMIQILILNIVFLLFFKQQNK